MFDRKTLENTARLYDNHINIEDLTAILQSGQFLRMDPAGQNKTPFHYAISTPANMRREKYRLLFQAKFDINAVDTDIHGCTHLHSLVMNEADASIHILLEEAANSQTTIDFMKLDRYGCNTLICAAKTRHEDIAIKLLELASAQKGFNIDHADQTGMTALHYACALGMPKLARTLLEKGAQSNIVNKENRTALELVAMSDEAIQSLLKAAHISPSRDEFATNNEVVDDNYQLVTLTNAGGTIFKPQETESIKANRAKVEKQLKGIVINSTYDHELRCKGVDDRKAVKLMAAKPLDQSGKDKILSQFDRMSGVSVLNAVKRDRNHVMTLMIEKGVDYSWLLRKFAADNHPALATLLQLDNIKDYINMVGKPSCMTALHNAAKFGHPDVCRMLYLAGAALDVIDKDGNTPMMTAALNKRSAVVTMLRSCGADLAIKNAASQTVYDILNATGQHALGQDLTKVVVEDKQTLELSARHYSPAK